MSYHQKEELQTVVWRATSLPPHFVKSAKKIGWTQKRLVGILQNIWVLAAALQFTIYKIFYNCSQIISPMVYKIFKKSLQNITQYNKILQNISQNISQNSSQNIFEIQKCEEKIFGCLSALPNILVPVN